MRWPKYQSFSTSISPSNEYSGFISFSMDCFDLLAVQGSLKSLLQHSSSEASILWRSLICTSKLLHIALLLSLSKFQSSLKVFQWGFFCMRWGMHRHIHTYTYIPFFRSLYFQRERIKYKNNHTFSFQNYSTVWGNTSSSALSILHF